MLAPFTLFLMTGKAENEDVFATDDFLIQEQLKEERFDLGNEVETPDIKIHSKGEIDNLIRLINNNLHRV